MEASMLFIVMAATSAFACLYAAAWAVSASVMRKRTALAAQGELPTAGGLLRWRLRNGIAILLPTARFLVKAGRVSEFADELVIACAERSIATTRESVVSVALLTTIVVATVVALVTGSLFGGAAVSACLVVVAYVLLGSARDKRDESVREAVPGALESMAACFGSGFTLHQTFLQVAQDTPGYLGTTFERSAHVLETGGTAQQALKELREGAHAPDLAFVAIALEVQHQSGGSMKQVLEAASDSVKSELSLRRSLRVQTAQARLSARVVVVMPFILIAVFSLVSPDFLTPFFSSPFGYALLALAVIMQVSGVMLVHRALSVEGVT